jgi:hypothetical protein
MRYFKSLDIQEIKPGMIELLNLKQSYSQNEIMDGDIFIIEKELTDIEYYYFQTKYRSKSSHFSTVIKYFEDFENRVNVSFLPRDPKGKEVSLKLSRLNAYPIVY